MVDFPSTYKPDVDSTYSNTPRVLSAPFGDGYSQNAKDGINAYVEKWDLSFSNRPKAHVAAIKTFLDTVSAVTPFNWTAPDDVSSKVWRMTDAGYKISKAEADTRTISFSVVRYFGV